MVKACLGCKVWNGNKGYYFFIQLSPLLPSPRFLFITFTIQSQVWKDNNIFMWQSHSLCVVWVERGFILFYYKKRSLYSVNEGLVLYYPFLIKFLHSTPLLWYFSSFLLIVWVGLVFVVVWLALK